MPSILPPREAAHRNLGCRRRGEAAGRRKWSSPPRIPTSPPIPGSPAARPLLGPALARPQPRPPALPRRGRGPAGQGRRALIGPEWWLGPAPGSVARHGADPGPPPAPASARPAQRWVCPSENTASARRGFYSWDVGLIQPQPGHPRQPHQVRTPGNSPWAPGNRGPSPS